MNSYDTDYYKRFVALKLLNPSLKVFIFVGGWGQGAVAWSNMASIQATRAVFIQSATQFMTMYGFDGIDLDVSQNYYLNHYREHSNLGAACSGSIQQPGTGEASRRMRPILSPL